MSGLSKVRFYRERGRQYELTDAEAAIRYRRAMDWIDSRPGQLLVDVGCKFALLRDYLRVRGLDYHYLGIDIDRATLDRIEPDHARESFLCHDVNHGLPVGSAKADYLICLELLEHLENGSAFLSEARRVLKPGGHLILSIPNPYCWMEFLQNLRATADGEGHIASFTQQNIDALTRFGGLRVEKVCGTFTRVPFTKRLFGRYVLIETGALVLTRSTMYLMSVL